MASDRLTALNELLALVRPIPEDWVPGRSRSALKNGSPELELLPCSTLKDLRNAWRKALKWPAPGQGLDKALVCCLACCASTKQVGDQLWLKIVGPPSCGKSEIAEALSTAKKWVYPKSTVRGFHSGFKSDREGAEDHSLIKQIKGKTLVTKDGDTILQSPALAKILSEARDLYDGVSRAHYLNAVSRDYESLRNTWLLFGTESLRKLDSSELGERFLDVQICETLSESLEDEIGWRVACQADREVSTDFDSLEAKIVDTPEKSEAKRMTGGYVDWLRTNAFRLKEINVPEDSLKRCMKLALFVSYMRSRPSKTQDEVAQRELSFRLIKQLVRLAKCLAFVYNKTAVDDEVMDVVRAVALDTARGRTMVVAKHLLLKGEEGSSVGSIILVTNQTEDRERSFLRFLRAIGVVEPFQIKVNKVVAGTRWRLTPRLVALCKEVL